MEGDREAVRLVAQPLQEVEPLARARQDDREVLTRHPDLLEPLGQADDGDVDDAAVREGPGRRVDLGQPAVDDDEVRAVGEPGRP